MSMSWRPGDCDKELKLSALLLILLIECVDIVNMWISAIAIHAPLSASLTDWPQELDSTRLSGLGTRQSMMIDRPALGLIPMSMPRPRSTWELGHLDRPSGTLAPSRWCSRNKTIIGTTKNGRKLIFMPVSIKLFWVDGLLKSADILIGLL